MTEEQTPTSEEIDSELLTAYLDGELSDAEAIAVEKRLVEDSAFHRQMCELQDAWDMLDSLPLVRPNSQFVNTTVEMAIAGHKPKSSLAGNIIKGLMLLLIPALVFGVSYFLKRESIEGPERELVANLPLIENHDRYTEVVFFADDAEKKDSAEDSIEFLNLIYKKGLFREVDDLLSDDSREEPVSDFEADAQLPDDQLIKDRSDRLSRMEDQQLSELFRKKKKFESLDSDQQQTLREFHDLLAEEPNRSKLLEAMSSYYDWLRILGSSQRANLQDLPLDKRIDEIGRITQQQARKNFGTIGSTKLPPNDSEFFYEWYILSIRDRAPRIRQRTGEVLAKLRDAKGLPRNETEIDRIKSGPIEHLVEFLMRNDRQYVGEILCDNATRENNSDSQTPAAGQEQGAAWPYGIDNLRDIVSDEARAIIDQPDFSEYNRRELILIWIETANRARFPIKSAALKAYYDELTQEKRDELDNLHPDDRHDRLSRMYWKEKIGDRSAPSEEESFQKFLRDSGWDSVFGIGQDDL